MPYGSDASGPSRKAKVSKYMDCKCQVHKAVKRRYASQKILRCSCRISNGLPMPWRLLRRLKELRLELRSCRSQIPFISHFLNDRARTTFAITRDRKVRRHYQPLYEASGSERNDLPPSSIKATLFDISYCISLARSRPRSTLGIDHSPMNLSGHFVLLATHIQLS